MNFRNLKNVSKCSIEYAKGYPASHICDLAIYKKYKKSHFIFLVGANFFIFDIFKFWIQILNGRGRFSGGKNCQKSPNFNRGPGGRRAPPGLAAENDELAGQFQLEVSVVQSTIDCSQELHSPRQTWKPTQKPQKFTEIHQNAKKHENRQNDVIFTD